MVYTLLKNNKIYILKQLIIFYCNLEICQVVVTKIIQKVKTIQTVIMKCPKMIQMKEVEIKPQIIIKIEKKKEKKKKKKTNWRIK